MTTQIKEQLILNGKKTSMASCLYLPTNDPRILLSERKKTPHRVHPDAYDRFIKFLTYHPFQYLCHKENPNFLNLMICRIIIRLSRRRGSANDKPDITSSTACWRRYLGLWEIKDNKLYLVSLEGRYKLINNDPIFAEWFDGELIVPQGKILHQVPFTDFDTVYESERYIRIKNGKVIGSRVIDNSEKVFDNDENPGSAGGHS